MIRNRSRINKVTSKTVFCWYFSLKIIDFMKIWKTSDFSAKRQEIAIPDIKILKLSMLTHVCGVVRGSISYLNSNRAKHSLWWNCSGWPPVENRGLVSWVVKLTLCMIYLPWIFRDRSLAKMFIQIYVRSSKYLNMKIWFELFD